MMLSLDFHATKIMFKYLYMIGIAKEMATVGNAKMEGKGRGYLLCKLAGQKVWA
jgi:hypothetical protein